MLRLAVITLLALGCNAQSYGGLQMGTEFTAPLVAAPVVLQSTYGTKSVDSYAVPQQVYAAPQQHYGPVEAAIHTRRTVEFRHVATPDQYIQPQIIEVNADHLPVQIHFKSASSPLAVQQSHTPSLAGPVEYTSYQDPTHRLVNEVIKPVIQEVREVIQPYRRVTQEIRPVVEEIHTLVHKGERKYQVIPLPIAVKGAYGSGAALAVNAGYKAAKAAAKA